MNDFQNQPAAQWMLNMIPQEFRALRLEEIVPRSAEQAEALEAVKVYAADILAGGRHACVLYGPPGGGKSMLAAGLWNALAPRIADRHQLADVRKAGTADNVLWVRGDRLVPEYWKPVEQADHRTAEQRTFHVSTAGLVVLDDLDKHPTGTWAANLSGLIDARCCQDRLPTVITMNHTPAALVTKYGEFGGPIVDRLIRMGAVFIRVTKGRDAPVEAEAPAL